VHGTTLLPEGADDQGIRQFLIARLPQLGFVTVAAVCLLYGTALQRVNAGDDGSAAKDHRQCDAGGNNAPSPVASGSSTPIAAMTSA